MMAGGLWLGSYSAASAIVRKALDLKRFGGLTCTNYSCFGLIYLWRNERRRQKQKIIKTSISNALIKKKLK